MEYSATRPPTPAVGLILYFGAWAYRIVTRKYYVWLPGMSSGFSEVGEGVRRAGARFLFSSITSSRVRNAAMMDRWVSEYPKIADRHRDSGGAPVAAHLVLPRRAADRSQHEGATEAGGGRVRRDRTPSSSFQRYAAIRTGSDSSGRSRGSRRSDSYKSADGATHFGFIHGNWSLDNSRGNAFCGNDRELAMLRELGCFGDYTFSSIFYERSRRRSTISSKRRMTTVRNPTIVAWRCGLGSSRRAIC